MNGFHDDLPEDEYHALQGYMSSSLAKKLNDKTLTPHKVKYEMDNPPEDTDAKSFGRLAHMYMLQQELFEKTYITDGHIVEHIISHRPDIKNPRATKEYKDRIRNLRLDNKDIILQEDLDKLMEMKQVFNNHPSAKALFQKGKAERSFFWTDEEYNVPCKIRTDYWRDNNIIVDYKTTVDASYDGFQRFIAKYGGDIQASFYLEGARQAYGKELENFVFVVQEKEAPYEIAVYSIDNGSIEVGDYKRRKALDIYSQCLKKNHWPSYPKQIQDIALPHWAFPQEE